MTNPQYQYYPCDPDYYVGQHSNDQSRGVTTWNLNNQYTIPLMQPGDYHTLTFTCTVPRCYSISNGNTTDASGTYPKYGRDSCNIVYNAWSHNNSGTVELEYTLNGYTSGLCRISGVAQHGATQAFDLANVAIYNDTAKNTLVIHNVSSCTIQVDHFKIYRTYKICNPHADIAGQCIYPEGPCHPGSTAGTSGNLDFTRVDTPCNCDGGGLSFTQVQDNFYAGSIIPRGGGSLSWEFDFSSYSGYNYQGKSICLFNFNQVYPNSTDPNNPDVPLVAKLNGNTINTYYLNRWNENNENRGLFASHDLTQNLSYDDDGPNTVTLINTGSVDVKMAEAIDIYRIFRASPITCCGACETSCQSCYFCEFCAAPCYSCYIACQEACEVECQGCQTGCEVTCQTGCEVSCQTGCQVSCQTGCEVACQNCQTGCEVACQTGCELACQTCEGFCEPQCYACETCYTCVGTCQTCQTPCEWSCQGCQTGCEISCQESCQLSCQGCYGCYTCQACEAGWPTRRGMVRALLLRL